MEDERENIKVIIQTNVYGYLGMLLEGRERFEEEALAVMNTKQCVVENGPADEGAQILRLLLSLEFLFSEETLLLYESNYESACDIIK